MKRVFLIAVIVDAAFVILLLFGGIKDFLWIHPWLHASIVGVLVAIPSIVGLYLSWQDGETAAEANRLRGEANSLRTEANGLRAETNTQGEQIARLTDQLDRERNKHLQQIAQNVKQPMTQAEKNAAKLQKYLGKRTAVSEGGNTWGAMGAQIVEVNDDTVTLFVPTGWSSSSAFAVYVRCDELEMIEVPSGGCDLQIRILKRYGNTREMGQITHWDQREEPQTAPLPRGSNSCNAQYTKDGSPTRRAIYVYSPTSGNPQYTLVTMEDGQETGVFYDNNVEISKKFAIIQIGYLAEGFRYGGGASGGSPDPLFICVH